MNTSERIKTIVNEISYNTLGDIGTDHGYIPIYACRTLKTNRAIACDINKAPLINAMSNISMYNMEKHIETRLGSGLTPINEGEVQAITIAGMGGELIIDILKSSESILHSFSQLILQPQSKIEKVRRYIHKIGFKIYNETFINEEDKYYTVINCIKGYQEKPYTFTEYFLGKILIQKKEELFLDFVRKEKVRLNYILNNICENENNTKKIEELKTYFKAYEEIL